jgi:hypothetical protein
VAPGLRFVDQRLERTCRAGNGLTNAWSFDMTITSKLHSVRMCTCILAASAPGVSWGKDLQSRSQCFDQRGPAAADCVSIFVY